MRSVLLAGILLTTAYVLISGFRLWRDRDTDVEQWRVHLSDTSLTLAEHVRQSFTAADLVLRSVTDYVNDAGIETDAELRSALATRQIFEMLRDRASSAPQVSVATIVASNGDIINFTRSWPPPPINLSDRDYFSAHLADPSLDVFLSVPVRNRGTGTWTFYFARKIKNSAGQTIGLTLAGLESAFFSDFYGRITNSQGSAISLLRADGALLARYPMRESVMGASYAEHPIFRQVLAGDKSFGTLITSEPRAAEGGAVAPRMIAPRRVQDYPVVVNLTVSQDVILSNWWKTAYSTAISTTLAAVLLITMTFWIAKLLKRQDENLVALEHARAMAEAAGNAKAEFLAHMSHEIRTPLNAVIGLSSLLRQTRLDPQQSKFVGIIGRSGDHLLSLLNNVLDLSRLEAGRIDIENGPIDVADLVASAIETADSLKGGKSLRISSTIDGGVPPIVIGDLGRVNQILLNLLSNAVKYTSAGTVNLSVAATGLDADHVSLRFTVKDTGAGISPDDQARLFEPFERVGQRVANDEVGSGLGLAISRRTVHLMGGRIGVVSKVGEGSSFWFELPFGIGKRELLVPPPISNERPTRSLSILVAEDTPANQVLVRAVLEKMGHSVQLVSDGAEAIEALRLGSFDVVLMDVQMPNLDGHQATRLIRQMPGPVASIPIIGVTAYARASDRRAVLDSGMNEYVSKPFRLSTLAAALRKVTEQGAHALSNAGQPDATADAMELALESLLAVVEPETFRKLIGEFESTIDMLLKSLEGAVSSGDEQTIRNVAHRLIGAVGQYGGKSASEDARAVEFAPQAELARRATDLADRCRDLRAAVHKWAAARLSE